MGVGRGVAGGHTTLPYRIGIPRRRFLTAGATLIGVAGAAAACGGGRYTSQPNASGGSAKLSQPKTGGEFTWAQQIDPFDYDPTGKVLQNGPWLELAYNALLSIKHGEGVGYSELVSEPGLAQKWE